MVNSFLDEEGHAMFLTPFLKLFNYLITLHCKWYLLQKKFFKKDMFLKILTFSCSILCSIRDLRVRDLLSFVRYINK